METLSLLSLSFSEILGIELVDAFATFIVLSYCKFLFTSFDILSGVKVYDINGNFKMYVSMNASIEYFGHKHLPFALLAIAVLFTLFQRYC